MLQLELTKATATLLDLNTRTEKHGADLVPACSLRFSAPQSADVLAFFHPDLRDNTFVMTGPKDLLDDPDQEHVKIRDPHQVRPFPRDEKMTGAKVSIEYGVGDPMVLADCEIGRIGLDPMDGGTVIVFFTVNCKPDAWKDVPRLYLMQAQGVTLTLTPAELPTLGEGSK